MEKACIKCNNHKLLEEFTKSKISKNGYRNTCKSCTNICKNNEKYKAKQKEYREKHRDIKIKYMSNYNNKPEVKKRVKEWFSNNREHVYKLNRINNKKKPHIQAWRGLLTRTLEYFGKSKESKTIILLGYSAIDLKNHIQSLFTEGMSWNNHGEWHIDHIKPVSKFDKSTQPSIVNALSNLKPLWATTREINGVVYEGNLNKRNNVK